MNRLPIIAASLVLASFAGIGVLIAISLIPYIHFIGVLAIVFITFNVLCACRVIYAFSTSMVRKLFHAANTISKGDVTVYHDGTTIHHLSAQHEEAKVTVKEIAAPRETTSLSDEDDVIELHNIGNSIRDIAKAKKLTTYRVRKIINQHNSEQDTLAID